MFGVLKKSKYHHLIEFPKKREFVVNNETKYPLFIYRHLHKKMIEIIEAIFGGYPENKYIFYPPDDWLCDYFDDIRDRFLEIDRSEPFMVLPVTDLGGFEPYSNYKDTTRSWEHLKKDIYDEHQMLVKFTQFGYEIPNDLQVLFNKIDELVKKHTEEKNRILHANHIYPANKYFGVLINRKSFRKDLLEYLSKNDQKNINIQMISDKFKKDLAYIWIVINQLNKIFEKKKINLKIVSENNHIRLITS